MDLLDAGQVKEIRQAFRNIADTFAFPIKIIRTTYTDGPFATPPEKEEIQLKAIRDYLSGKGNEDDRYRNPISTQGTHEFSLYIHWDLVVDNNLADLENRVLLDHNDVVEMEGQIYEILAFGGIADMTKFPAFLQLVVRRRFQSPAGADEV